MARELRRFTTSTDHAEIHGSVTMFADNGNQLTLAAYDDAPKHEAARERQDHADLLVNARKGVGELEDFVHGAEAFKLQQWLDLSPDKQAMLLPARSEHLRNELADRLDDPDTDADESEDAGRPAFGYDHGRLESARDWGFD